MKNTQKNSKYTIWSQFHQVCKLENFYNCAVEKDAVGEERDFRFERLIPFDRYRYERYRRVLEALNLETPKSLQL